MACSQATRIQNFIVNVFYLINILIYTSCGDFLKGAGDKLDMFVIHAINFAYVMFVTPTIQLYFYKCCIFSSDYLVQVKAQVMTRDDSTGGWVPMGGGGMSNVGLRKLVISTGAEDLRKEYLIHGQRIADESVSIDLPSKNYLANTRH